VNQRIASRRSVFLAAVPVLGLVALCAGAASADGTSSPDWVRSGTLTGSPDGDAVPAPAAAQPTRTDMEALQEVNRLRAQHGLGPISFERKLFAAAYAHSTEQIQRGYMGHESRDPSRATLAQRMNAEGYYGRMYAEVVARDYVDARSVVDAWMQSPRHREVLLDPDLSQGAFARVDGSIPGLNRWTGDFSAPRENQTPTPAPAPKASVAPSATPSSAARVSLPANNAPRSGATGYSQPPIPQPTARSSAPASTTAMPPVPQAGPRVLVSSSGSVPVSPPAAAAKPAPAPTASTQRPTNTQPRVTTPLPQVPRVVASAPPPAAPPRATQPAPVRGPAASSPPPQPYRPAPQPRRMPRRVGDCAT
jgi:uncharacterized protein YkwD